MKVELTPYQIGYVLALLDADEELNPHNFENMRGSLYKALDVFSKGES